MCSTSGIATYVLLNLHNQQEKKNLTSACFPIFSSSFAVVNKAKKWQFHSQKENWIPNRTPSRWRTGTPWVGRTPERVRAETEAEVPETVTMAGRNTVLVFHNCIFILVIIEFINHDTIQNELPRYWFWFMISFYFYFKERFTPWARVCSRWFHFSNHFRWRY